MQQQFGVFQLVLAQLLAWSNPGDPLINLLNPAQQPPTPQQNPQPVQHAPALSESQGQSHIAPAQQPLPNDVTRHLDSLEKLVADQRGAPPQHHAADSIPHPLNTNITLEPYPAGFKIPQLETYDGTKDPDDHLHAFYSCMQALPSRSISSYIEMAYTFAIKFSNRRLIRKTTSELLRVKQRDGESLKNYMSRFNDAVLEVSSFDQAVGIAAVISSLNHDRFRDSLIKHPATTFSEVNDRSLKFITVEEYALAQNSTPSKNQNLDWRDENPSKKKMRMTQNQGKPPVNWTPFNLPRSQIFMQIKNKMDLRRPDPMRTTAASRDHTRYCDFHQDHGYTIEQCNSLRSELESLAQKGMLNEYIQKAEQLRFVREQRPQPQGVRNPPNRQGVGYQQALPPLRPPARIIQMITRGLEAVVTPHNDPLITSITINNCEVQRVLVDTRSAPDIMYFHCFESLGLDPTLLQRYDGPIYGFNNQPVPVEGILTMNVAFGSDRNYVIPSVRFLVVKMASSFNVVIGQPTLTEIRAVVSQSHLCMQFPTPMGIATLRDNRLEDETRAAPIEDVEEVPIDNRGLSRKTQIGTRLNPEERAELIAFLRANNDVFAWTSADMPGIPPLAIKEEVEKLLQAGFVRKVDYCEWVANPVLVNKANGKWRMCIDYTNLNQACPKDCYPMPSIDKLVEAASGATYQKMVTIVFQAQIGRNLEVYVDDIVVKSLKAGNHLADLDETCNNLRKNRTWLNPTKCIFSMESGKFLGFMVSRRGIEVNLEKIRAIVEMEPPKSVKDIQRLIGRVAALHRFISKSADKCLPFFKIMRLAAQKDESGKQKKFEWNQECQAAFEELKSYLSSPPLLTKAIDGEILYLYLGISGEAISSVLVREEAKQQKPIYYINSVLHGAELRSTIRAQALADFIVECTPCHLTPNPKLNNWTLYVDGASSNKGSGAGALLIGPDGYRSEHALKFNFDATNNMAEYEALLLGLQLALELKISAIQVYSDSQLVVNQIYSICEAVDLMMAYSLSKFASDNSLSSRSVFVEVLDEPNFMKLRMMEISTNPNTPSWTNSIIFFLQDGTVPEDKQEAMRLRKKASWYTLVDGVLYKRSFSLPLLRCLNPYEAEYALQEVHEGVCGSHIEMPEMPILRTSDSPTSRRTHKLDSTMAICSVGTGSFGPIREKAWWCNPSDCWPTPKWVEARPLSSLTSKKVEDFVFSSIICRYGIPNQILADNGTQFNCSSFRDFCVSYGIKLQFTLVYHPESNGMVESINKCIIEGIKLRLEQHKAKCANELNNVFLAYRTTSQTATGETPYHLAFGTEAVIPIEIGVLSFRVIHFNEGRNGQLLWENLDLLAEVKEEARLLTLVYKQKLANFYNKRVHPQTLKVGDLVLRKASLTGFETRFGKLAPNWEGPYTVAEVPHLGAYVLQDAEGKRVPRVWNVNNLKKFYP
ncbi:hypothetical protein SLEP1_g18937 [Rubroshorea leprosula]|uniref:Integrase catalytic domain-containing protein n=1 Tax=Rubroshorea leprosula TaxID=152421 RepID=A0AAV5J2L9_9ROSI|nr:hypothetical protein SLEP1_g18937 [Rubroshorea leprosula]